MLKNWIDVVGLSKKVCSIPIRGYLKYATCDNLVGRPIDGYEPCVIDVCLMTSKAAHALCEVQNDLVRENSNGIIIFDSYRPLRAVKDFGKWMKLPPVGEFELKRKAIHYPDIEKAKLSEAGYLSSTVSNHCFGGTVDLSLVDLATGEELEMGSVFDFLGKKSHSTITKKEIGEVAFKNRALLNQKMSHRGFVPYEKEYWHFSFHEKECSEPADFEITSALRGLGCEEKSKV